MTYKDQHFLQRVYFLLSLAPTQLLEADTNCRGMTHSKHPLPARQIIASVKTAVKLQPQLRVSAGLYTWCKTGSWRSTQWDNTNSQRASLAAPNSDMLMTETSKKGGPTDSSLRLLNAQKQGGKYKPTMIKPRDKKHAIFITSFYVLAICGWWRWLAGPTVSPDQQAGNVCLPSL